jgi:hypothetical protein
MTEALFPDIDRECADAAEQVRAQEQRYREHEADFTPRLVARPLVAVTMPRAVGRYLLNVPDGSRPLRVLGICSGPGVFESEVLRWCVAQGINVHITAVEIRPEEREHLRRHAHEIVIGDWHEGLGMVRDGDGWVWGATSPAFDLVIGNPAFSQARAPIRRGWPTTSGAADVRKRLRADAVAAGSRVELAEYDPEMSMPLLCLQRAEVVALYGTQQCWTKTASGWLVRLHRDYDFVTDIPGSVGHREGKGGDQVPYSLFTWMSGAPSRSAITSMIEPLDSSERNWTVRPGTETDEWLLANGVPVLRGGVIIRPK